MRSYEKIIKVLFVCHGNICRSPMAEFVMKDLVKKAHLEDQFEIASAATSTEEIWGGRGNPVYPPARAKLISENTDPVLHEHALCRRIDRIAGPVPDLLTCRGRRCDLKLILAPRLPDHVLHDELAHRAAADIAVANE